jgi:hypothetical protein
VSIVRPEPQTFKQENKKTPKNTSLWAVFVVNERNGDFSPIDESP